MPSILTEDQRHFLAGQHELCEDVDSVEVYDPDLKTKDKWRPLNPKERENFLTRRRVIRMRIRKRLEKVKAQLDQAKFDLELLQGWPLHEELQSLIDDLIIRVSHIEALRKFLRRRRKVGEVTAPVVSRGYYNKIDMTCMFCDVEQFQDIVAFKDGRWKCRTGGIPRSRKEELFLKALKQWLNRTLIACPKCGKSELEWSCCHERI